MFLGLPPILKLNAETGSPCDVARFLHSLNQELLFGYKTGRDHDKGVSDTPQNILKSTAGLKSGT